MNQTMYETIINCMFVFYEENGHSCEDCNRTKAQRGTQANIETSKSQNEAVNLFIRIFDFALFWEQVDGFKCLFIRIFGSEFCLEVGRWFALFGAYNANLMYKIIRAHFASLALFHLV